MSQENVEIVQAAIAACKSHRYQVPPASVHGSRRRGQSSTELNVAARRDATLTIGVDGSDAT